MYELLKKKYSQNFLIDKNIIKKISSLVTKKSLIIIEIGPGDGRLTDYLINLQPKILKLIEIDKSLIPILNSKYNGLNNLIVINQDILKYQFNEKIDLIISNLPYKISSQILVKICSLSNLPDNLILMFQKEFAQRLLENKLNSLNSLVNCFYDIDKKFDVSKNCFRPIPKIDSTVLSFSKKKKALITKNELLRFINFKRSLFSHKRKILKNLLKNYDFNLDEIDLNERVENLSLLKLIKIFRKINF